MKITRVLINRCCQNNLLAYVNIVFDDCFIVRGIRVVERPDKTRLVVMPSRQTKVGDFKDVCHPITTDFRRVIERLILSKLGNMAVSWTEGNGDQPEHPANLGS